MLLTTLSARDLEIDVMEVPQNLYEFESMLIKVVYGRVH